MSSTNDSNCGKPTKSDKPKEKSSISQTPSLNLSDYVGIPKAQAVQSYVKSMYGWICGPTATSNQSPQSSSTAQVTLAAATSGTNRKIAVHPSQQNKDSFNIISINKTVTADGEPLSQSIGSSAESSNNTTEIPFSDLSTTPSDLTLTKNPSTTTLTGKEREEDSWTNLKDVKSENETMISSSKSNTDISKDLKTNNNNSSIEKPLSASPKRVEENPQDDIQFSFMNQLRVLEDEKNKEFLVPDQVYFGDREKSSQVHKPNSQKMEPKPQNQSATAAGASTLTPSIPPIANVKQFLSNLLPVKKPSTTDNQNQKE